MTDITLEQRARQVIADWHREKGCSQQVIDDCLSGNITIPEFYMELLEAALRLSAGADCPKRLLGWRTGDYLYETTDRSQAINWLGNVEVLPIFEGDPNTKLAAAPRHETGEGS